MHARINILYPSSASLVCLFAPHRRSFFDPLPSPTTASRCVYSLSLEISSSFRLSVLSPSIPLRSLVLPLHRYFLSFSFCTSFSHSPPLCPFPSPQPLPTTRSFLSPVCLASFPLLPFLSLPLSLIPCLSSFCWSLFLIPHNAIRCCHLLLTGTTHFYGMQHLRRTMIATL